MTLLFKLTPKDNAEVLSYTPKCKKSEMYLTKKMSVRYSLFIHKLKCVCCEFIVNESTIQYIQQKQEEISSLYIELLWKIQR